MKTTSRLSYPIRPAKASLAAVELVSLIGQILDMLATLYNMVVAIFNHEPFINPN